MNGFMYDGQFTYKDEDLNLPLQLKICLVLTPSLNFNVRQKLSGSTFEKLSSQSFMNTKYIHT